MKNYLMITMVTEEGRRKTEEVYCEKNDVFVCVCVALVTELCALNI